MPAVVILLLVFGGGYYFYSQKTSLSNPQDPKKQAQEDKKLIAEIGKLMELPAGENPTVATVTDITKLNNQPFFQKAKNGDKVLIYQNAQKAILYSTVSKKILNVAPFNVGSASAQVASSSPSIKPVTATQTPAPKTSIKANSTSATFSAKEK